MVTVDAVRLRRLACDETTTNPKTCSEGHSDECTFHLQFHAFFRRDERFRFLLQSSDVNKMPVAVDEILPRVTFLAGTCSLERI